MSLRTARQEEELLTTGEGREAEDARARGTAGIGGGAEHTCTRGRKRWGLPDAVVSTSRSGARAAGRELAAGGARPRGPMEAVGHRR